MVVGPSISVGNRRRVRRQRITDSLWPAGIQGPVKRRRFGYKVSVNLQFDRNGGRISAAPTTKPNWRCVPFDLLLGDAVPRYRCEYRDDLVDGEFVDWSGGEGFRI